MSRVHEGRVYRAAELLRPLPIKDNQSLKGIIRSAVPLPCDDC